VATTIQEQYDLAIQSTMDDMIHAFMQIANYRLWLKGGYMGKAPDSTPLKLKAVAKYGDPRLLANAMKSCIWAENLSTRDCALKGFKLFDVPVLTSPCLVIVNIMSES
jgi:hypothetical protein